MAETLAILMVVAVIAALMAGYPVALTLAGVSLAFAGLGHLAGAMDLAILGALPQRIFGVMTNEVLLAIPLIRVHGRDAGTLAHRRGFAGAHGSVVRAVARGAWLFRRAGRRAARRLDRHRRRHRGDHGADHAAGDAAPRLRSAACGRHGRGLRDAGADHSALDRAGGARRPAQQCLSVRSARAGQLSRRVSVGERSVRRRGAARAAAGRPLSRLSGRDGDRGAGKLSADHRARHAPRSAGSWSKRCWRRSC